MKKLFLTLWLLSFLGGGYYLKQNYTFVQLSTEQLAQVGSNSLQSSILSPGAGENVSHHSDVLLRVGAFAIVKNSSELLVPEEEK